MSNSRLVAMCCVSMTLAACAPDEDPTVGDPLPDTIPITGTASDLPEGMPLPPAPDDTAPR
jgi:hypothetical protein